MEVGLEFPVDPLKENTTVTAPIVIFAVHPLLLSALGAVLHVLSPAKFFY